MPREAEVARGRAHLRYRYRIQPHRLHQCAPDRWDATEVRRGYVALGEQFVGLCAHTRVHFWMLEYGVDERGERVRDRVQARDIRPGQAEHQVIGGHGSRIVLVGTHDVVDQDRRRAVLLPVVGDHLVAQLGHPRLRPNVPRVAQHDPGPLLGDQHVEHVQSADADVAHVLRTGRAGEQLAELVRHQVLHALYHGNRAAGPPGLRHVAVGDCY